MPMIVNTAWLLEYLEPKCSHEDLLDAFPRLGLEVEQTHELKKELDSVRIGFVRRKEPVAGCARVLPLRDRAGTRPGDPGRLCVGARDP